MSDKSCSSFLSDIFQTINFSVPIIIRGCPTSTHLPTGGGVVDKILVLVSPCGGRKSIKSSIDIFVTIRL